MDAPQMAPAGVVHSGYHHAMKLLTKCLGIFALALWIPAAPLLAVEPVHLEKIPASASLIAHGNVPGAVPASWLNPHLNSLIARNPALIPHLAPMVAAQPVVLLHDAGRTLLVPQKISEGDNVVVIPRDGQELRIFPIAREVAKALQEHLAQGKTDAAFAALGQAFDQSGLPRGRSPRPR